MGSGNLPSDIEFNEAVSSIKNLVNKMFAESLDGKVAFVADVS